MTYLFLAALVLVALWPVYLARQRQVIGRAARQGAPGSFVRLSQGVTRYQWFGPSRGPVVVAVHGLTTPSTALHALANGVGKLGYRVLTYDLYGRGLSDAPKGPQDAAFFIRQLTDLLENQGLDDDLTLMGYSMGGAIVTAFAAQNPDRVRRLILLAPTGMTVNEDSLTRFCRMTPVLGDWLFHVVVSRRMRQEITQQGQAPDIQTLQRQEHDRAGFLSAVLSSRRGLMADRQEEQHRALGKADVPVVAIWGEADRVIPLAAVGQLSQWNRAVRQEVVAGAGHGLPFDHSDDVVEVVRSVLGEVD